MFALVTSTFPTGFDHESLGLGGVILCFLRPQRTYTGKFRKGLPLGTLMTKEDALSRLTTPHDTHTHMHAHTHTFLHLKHDYLLWVLNCLCLLCIDLRHPSGLTEVSLETPSMS